MSQPVRPDSFRSVGEVLYLNEEFKDVTVVVPTDTGPLKFPAHKLMLSSGSPIFRSRLEDASVDEIVLEDISPSTAELLLRYIYCGDLQLESWIEGIELLEAAFRFQVKELVQKCGRFLEDVISLSNVCYIYEKASACALPVLQDKCLKLILDAGFIVMRSSSFEVLNKDCVMDIVASSDLNIDSELMVFKTLFRWVEIECCRTGIPTTEENIQTLIKPFLQHVCIDDMSDADKSELPSSILTYVKPNNRNRVGFSVPESLMVHSERLEFEIADFSLVDFVGERLSCLRFSIDHPVHLIGVGFSFNSSSVPVDLTLTIVKENGPTLEKLSQVLNPFTPIQSTTINQRTWYNTENLLRQPVFLETGDIYNLYVVDPSGDVQCPKITIPNNILYTDGGLVNFTVHGDVWGVECLIAI